MPGGSRGAADSLPEWNAQTVRQFTRIANGKAVFEIGAVAIKHQHAKNFVVDVALDERCSARQHFVEIERRVDFVADLSERGENFGGELQAAAHRNRLSLFVSRIH